MPALGFQVECAELGIGDLGRKEWGWGGLSKPKGCDASNGAGIRNLNLGCGSHAAGWGTDGGIASEGSCGRN